MAKRKRRAFTKEFKAQTVRLVRDRGKSIGVLARELDLGDTVLRTWARQAEVDAGRGRPGALTTDERLASRSPPSMERAGSGRQSPRPRRTG